MRRIIFIFIILFLLFSCSKLITEIEYKDYTIKVVYLEFNYYDLTDSDYPMYEMRIYKGKKYLESFKAKENEISISIEFFNTMDYIDGEIKKENERNKNKEENKKAIEDLKEYSKGK